MAGIGWLTERIEAWRRARRRPESDAQRLVEAWAELARILATDAKLDSCMQSVCERTTTLLHADRCSFYLSTDQGFARLAGSGGSTLPGEPFADGIATRDDPRVVLVSRSREAQWIAELPDVSPAIPRSGPAGGGGAGILLAPVFDRRDSLRGFLEVVFRRPRSQVADWSETVVAGIAQLVALHVRQHDTALGHAELEARLEDVARLEALGHFARSVAHDFGNRLTVMFGTAELARADLGPSSARKHLDELMLAVESAAELTKQLLNFSHAHVAKDDRANASEVSRDAFSRLRRVVPADIELSIHVFQDDLFVPFSATDYERILTHLVDYAAGSCDAGDAIRVELKSTWIDPEAPVELADFAGSHVAELVVEDTGRGIPSEDLPRVFDPYFATFETAGGSSGLGLSSVYGIVRAVGGLIEAESDGGEGKRFRVWLPLESSRSAASEPGSATGRTAPTTATILLVDDNDPVRGFMRGVLEQRGYRVLEAVSGRDALELAQGEKAPIDLLVSDVVMPELGGFEAALLLKALRPELRILFVSAYSPEYRRSAPVLPPDAAFLPKPFSGSRLLVEVDRCLARGSLLH